MRISLMINREITSDNVIYEVSAYGDKTFKFKINALIEGSFKEDIEMILNKCRSEEGIKLSDIEAVLIYLMISHNLYQILYGKKHLNVLTIIVGIDQFHIYTYSFKDKSKKEDNIVDLYFDEWLEAVKYIQEVTTKTDIETINNIHNCKSPNADFNNLIIPQDQDVHAPHNALSVKFIYCDDKNITLELAFKKNGEIKKKNVVINAAYPLHIYEAIRTSELLPYFPNKIIVYVSTDKTLSFLFNCKNMKYISVQKDLITVGGIDAIKCKISSKLQDVFNEYPHIKNHVYDWINTFKEFNSNDISSQQGGLAQNTNTNLPSYCIPCRISVFLFNNQVKLKWNNLGGDVKYILYRQKNNNVVRVSSTVDNFYSFIIQSGEVYTYAVICVPRNLSSKEIEKIHPKPSNFTTFSKKSLIGTLQPAIKIGTVYYINNSSCGHSFWKVEECNTKQVKIQCTECNLVRTVDREYVLTKCKYAYSSETRTHNKQYSTQSKKQLTQVDVIVLSSTKHCTYLNHTIDNYIGILPVATEKSKTNIEIDIGYCRECNKYIMLTSTYLKIKGDPICMVKDMRTGKIYNKPNDGFWINSSEHILHKYGYNVRIGNGMLSTDRQAILIKLINNGILSKTEIISHLEYCVNMASGREHMSSAIRKWQQDIEFVRKYRAQAKSVAVGSVTLKYRK